MKVLAVFLVALAMASAAEVKSKICEEKCASCPVVERSSCLAGMEKDRECQCCDICSRFEGQKCDMKGEEFKYGQCGDGLECREVTGGAICQCMWNEMVCGSNDQGYNNICQLMAAAVREGLLNLEIKNIGPCTNETKIISPPKYVKNATDQNVVLSCEAIGNPVPSIKWEVTRSNGKTTEMPGDDDHIMIATRGGPGMFKISAWMQIEGLKKRHEGDYTCIASNEHKTERSTARVKVAN